MRAAHENYGHPLRPKPLAPVLPSAKQGCEKVWKERGGEKQKGAAVTWPPDFLARLGTVLRVYQGALSFPLPGLATYR